MKKLIILGAGGYGQTVADIAEQLGYEIAFLDDNSPLALGVCGEFKRFMDAKTLFYPAFGNNERRVEWLEQPFEVQPDKSTKQMIASSILKTRLANGPAKATDVLEELKNEGIGDRTIHQVKKQLEIRSVKRDAAWYWLLPESDMSSGR